MNDAIPLDFDPAQLRSLNILLAFLMFGVSLSLRPAAFREVARAPRLPLLGLLAQYVFVPALTCLGAWLFRIDPPLALGMMLVAACPGGSFSNVLTWLARGNVALAVSLTAVSSLMAPLVMPLNFAFYAWLNPYTRPLLRAITIPTSGIMSLVLLVLALPLLLGMLTGHRYPVFATRAEKPLRGMATVLFLGLVGVAFAANFGLFLERFSDFFWLVIAQNALALGTGFLTGRIARVAEADRRALTIEVGIHNTGLGLAVLFTFFPEAGSMMLIAAFWGVWHLISGLGIALWWARRPLAGPAPASEPARAAVIR
jgi:BASS family bile acid:Na+ symporter